MSVPVTLTIHGTPVAKGRPRISVRGGFARAYTPAKTRHAEETIAGAANYALAYGGAECIPDGAIALEITLYRTPPKGASRKTAASMLAGKIHPTTKPDLDNMAKLVTDALNGMLYRDDAQITDLVVRKRYGQTAKTEVTMRRA